MNETAVIFKNITEAEFIGRWGGVKYPFKAGQEMYMETWKANHFAKHLIDQILNDQKKMTNDQKARGELLSQIVFAPAEEVKTEEIIDKNIREDKKKSKKKVEKETEFADLKE